MNDMPFMQAPVTYSLIIANLIFSGYALFVDPGLINRFALHVGAILRGSQYERLITHAFLHAGPAHFAFNMITLYSFGPVLERILGPTKFGVLYLGALLAAAALSLWVKQQDLTYSAIGASGAVSGVILAFCVFYPFAGLNIFFIPIAIPAIVFAALYIAFSIYASNSPTLGGGIAHEAHLGGAIGGVLLLFLLEPRAWDALMYHLGR